MPVPAKSLGALNNLAETVLYQTDIVMENFFTSCTSPKLSLKQIRPLAGQQCSLVKVSPGRSRCCSLQLRASTDDGKDSFDESLEEEARLEALERGVKRKQGSARCLSMCSTSWALLHSNVSSHHSSIA